jgi:hypothetical protein
MLSRHHNLVAPKAQLFLFNKLYRNETQVGDKSSRVNFLLPALCLTLACVIYTVNPPDNAFIRSCFKVTNIEHLVWRDLFYHPLMKTVRNHLPDALWALSMLHILIQVWRPTGIRSSVLFVALFITFTVSLEISQLIEFIPGYYDIIDTSIYIAIGLMYLTYQTFKIKHITTRRQI